MKLIIDIDENFYNGESDITVLKLLESLKYSIPLDECEVEDCISRKQAYESAKCIYESNSEAKGFDVLKMLNELPSIYPKSDKSIGKWKIVADRYKCCSNCGQKLDMYHGIMHDIDFKYCPKCGSRNIVEEQGENT